MEKLKNIYTAPDATELSLGASFCLEASNTLQDFEDNTLDFSEVE